MDRRRCFFHILLMVVFAAGATPPAGAMDHWPKDGDPFLIREDLRHPVVSAGGFPDTSRLDASFRTVEKWEPPEDGHRNRGDWDLFRWPYIRLTVSRYVMRDAIPDPRGTVEDHDAGAVFRSLHSLMKSPMDRRQWGVLGDVFQPQIDLRITF